MEHKHEDSNPDQGDRPVACYYIPPNLPPGYGSTWSYPREEHPIVQAIVVVGIVVSTILWFYCLYKVV